MPHSPVIGPMLPWLQTLLEAPSGLATALAKIAAPPAVLALEDQLKAAHDAVVSVRARSRPRCDLVGVVGRDRDTRSTTESTSYWSTELRGRARSVDLLDAQ